MTQYLSTLTLEELNALTLEELSTLGINEPILSHGHQPWLVGNANDHASLYIVTNAEDYAT